MTSCTACRVAFARVGDQLVPRIPAVRPGALMFSHDYRRDPIPGRSSRAPQQSRDLSFGPHPDGIVFTFTESTTYTAPVPGRGARDACVRASFSVLGPQARIAIVTRWCALSTASTFYSFELSVDTNQAFVSCIVTASGTADWLRLATGRFDRLSRGRPIALELRCQGPTIHALIDGQPVLALHDGRLGEGTVGFRVGREGPPGPPTSIVCHGLEVAEVAP